jgi:hypothetical protein
LTTFKIRGERLLNALAWMAYVDRERRPHPQSVLPDDHPARPLASRFQMYGILATVSIQHLWPDARSLLLRNPVFQVAEVEIGGLVEDLERRYRPTLVEAFVTFLKAVACGEVTEADLQS